MTARCKRIIIVASISLAACSALAAAALGGIGVPCVFYKITGLLCPGCGNTRAAAALLRMDFKSSFLHNPLFLPEIVYIVWVYAACCRNYICGRGFRYRSKPSGIDIAMLAAVIVWGIVRNIL